ncbi:hypothetical protein H2200_008932 [Cladophialophora chaetospira]|uniref:Ankyrin repeat protein n=1 Tax=Cladophialophora chaetospira TaxID=386627 RepID=A0AA38X504_9EURO|nr:hypothetical protein H2200_008932 [Cladophialophora chaetospira]
MATITRTLPAKLVPGGEIPELARFDASTCGLREMDGRPLAKDMTNSSPEMIDLRFDPQEQRRKRQRLAQRKSREKCQRRKVPQGTVDKISDLAQTPLIEAPEDVHEWLELHTVDDDFADFLNVAQLLSINNETTQHTIMAPNSKTAEDSRVLPGRPEDGVQLAFRTGGSSASHESVPNRSTVAELQLQTRTYEGSGGLPMSNDLPELEMSDHGFSPPSRGPVSISARSRHSSPMASLINLGSSPSLNEPSSIRSNSGTTLLHMLAARGQESMVRLLVESGASLNERDNDGRTPLHHAASNGHTDIVDVLLEHEADGNLYDHMGLAAIHVAAQNGHEKTVRLMLRLGIDPNIKTRQ